jgi:hypothetical protein
MIEKFTKTEKCAYLALRLAPLLLRLGVQQICKALDLRQVHFAVHECASRKFARIRESCFGQRN